jgi:hypothetical protein
MGKGCKPPGGYKILAKHKRTRALGKVRGDGKAGPGAGQQGKTNLRGAGGAADDNAGIEEVGKAKGENRGGWLRLTNARTEQNSKRLPPNKPNWQNSGDEYRHKHY